MSRWAALETVVSGVPAGREVGIAVRNLDDGGEWQYQGDLVVPAASTAKLGIMVALARAFESGRLSPDEEWAIGPAVKVGGSGVLVEMRDGLALTLADHAYLMIAISDNTASNVVIDAVGLAVIQETLRDMGMSSLEINRRFLGRLPGPGEFENLTDAADLVRTLTAIYEDRAASPEWSGWMRSLLTLQQHRSRLGRALPSGYSFAGKSGTLTALAHDCGVIAGPGGRLAIAVLTRGWLDEYEADAWIGQVATAAVASLGMGAPRHMGVLGPF